MRNSFKNQFCYSVVENISFSVYLTNCIFNKPKLYNMLTIAAGKSVQITETNRTIISQLIKKIPDNQGLQFVQ
jgi:hypothetical protein